ncbi:ABC transporter ATP-binding protein [Mariniphaga sediminis]|uniref:ABC transporter ATP-binding protein n=2 Tax=Mariniphaga sediminis TaxID=1628158 RepID=A0A399D4H8_9BACT|nr:ABC transporter ATP-binding protein [Mariniphaga sediminis]RIH65582.1 ABC transporter ATP-binding protein [Mariniphaga sediminis]RIH65585.1 ABC transporter ATP-binding protein [Mariniphaga sediminis]
MENIVECRNLTHYYGNKMVYEDLNFNIKKGSILGLLGKNGTGKTTTINILNGYLTPRSGECIILGENSKNLSPYVKSQIGYLIENHVQYAFMNIYQIEKFYSGFYPNWKREAYYDLMAKLKVTPKQKISTMSCGQRSQVALGLILAQDPELLVLDDFTMGLDPGYRRLFIDYLRNYAKAEGKTVFTTSHIIQDMERLIDECIVFDYNKVLVYMPVKEFMSTFKQFNFEVTNPDVEFEKGGLVENYEKIDSTIELYTYSRANEVESYLASLGIAYSNFREVPMTLEDAFIGLTGKY